ncbi:HERC1 [Symbiodinium sp. CCMP2592]|nr:HERC1 [Symbiodinium sp. CCMP2592]
MADAAPGPDPGSLARLLEADRTVRRRLREKGHMTRWPSERTTGVPSCKGMACNARILEIVAEWWCPSMDSPMIIPIEVMRREVNALRGPAHMDMKHDPLQAELDSDGIKKLFTHGLRRLKSGASRPRDPALEDFFHILEWYWTELRTDDDVAPDMLMLEDGSVDDPYVGDASDGHVLADDSGAPILDESAESATTLALGALTPAASDSSNPDPEPEATDCSNPEPLPLPEASHSSNPEPLPLPEASHSSNPEPLPLPEASHSSNPEPLPLPKAILSNPFKGEKPDKVPEPAARENPNATPPGKIAQTAPPSPGEPAPSTPKPKLAKLPHFEIPGPEHERALLKAQMEQQIAALRYQLALRRSQQASAPPPVAPSAGVMHDETQVYDADAAMVNWLSAAEEQREKAEGGIPMPPDSEVLPEVDVRKGAEVANRGPSESLPEGQMGSEKVAPVPPEAPEIESAKADGQMGSEAPEVGSFKAEGQMESEKVAPQAESAEPEQPSDEDVDGFEAPIVKRTDQRENFKKAAQADKDKRGRGRGGNTRGRGRAGRGRGQSGRGRGGRGRGGRGRGGCDTQSEDEKPKGKKRKVQPEESSEPENENDNGTVRYSQEELVDQKPEKPGGKKPAKEAPKAKSGQKESPKSKSGQKESPKPKLQQESPKSKLGEESPKSKGAQKESPKPKAKAKAATKKRAKPDAETEEPAEDEAAGNRRKTFAGRRMPKTAGSALDRYNAMVDSFLKIVYPQVDSPSTWEGEFWSFAYQHLLERPLDASGYGKVARAQARKFLNEHRDAVNE